MAADAQAELQPAALRRGMRSSQREVLYHPNKRFDALVRDRRY